MENKMETTIMENQMGKKMENEMEYIGVIYYSSFHFFNLQMNSPGVFLHMFRSSICTKLSMNLEVHSAQGHRSMRGQA